MPEGLAAPDAAARWYARLAADDVTADEQRAFEGWLAQDGANRSAWATVERAALRTDLAAADPTLRSMLDEALTRPARSQRRPVLAVAAVFACALLGGVVLYGHNRTDTGAGAHVAMQDYATRAGETRPVALADGSRIMMDARSRLRVGLGKKRRDVELMQGQALFRVAKDAARPFTVSVGAYTVTALGTYFDVDLRARGVNVALIEGKVRVARSGTDQEWVLTPGMTLSLDGDRAVLTQGKAQAAAGWSTGTLSFDATSLADVVGQINRHFAHKLVLDPRLAAQPFSGVIRIDDPKGERALIEALDAYRIARVSRSRDGETLLVPY